MAERETPMRLKISGPEPRTQKAAVSKVPGDDRLGFCCRASRQCFGAYVRRDSVKRAEGTEKGNVVSIE